MAEPCTLAVVASTAETHCSAAARDVSLSPGGTAASFDLLVLVERPLPWPADVTELADLAEVATSIANAAEGQSWRLQAITPVERDTSSSSRRVLCYQHRPGPFAGFEGSETVVDADQVPRASADLVIRGADAADASPVTVKDVLICGHGARDRCCGSLGTRLAAASSELLPGVRLWRTSHTGGHRFAPTAMTLPTGDVWGYLDTGALQTIVRREGHPRDIVHLHRGSSGLPSPGLQLLDRFALSQEGWSWSERPRRGVEEPLGDGAARVRLEGEAGDVLYEGIVGARRRVVLPECGTDRPGKPFIEHELLAARAVGRSASTTSTHPPRRTTP